MLENINDMQPDIANIPLPSDIRHDYSPFIYELKYLEEFCYQSNIDRNLIDSISKQYYYLLDRVKKYANYGKKLVGDDKLHNLDNKDITILNYIHSSILSRLNQLKSSNSSDLVIDILGFAQVIESNINSLKEQQQIEQIGFYKESYNSQIDQKIKEANDFIQKLQAAIKKYDEEINSNVNKLLKETEELKTDAKENRVELDKNKEALEKQLPLKMLFRSLKVVTTVLAFTGPQGALAGSLIDSSSNITEGFVLNDSKGKKLPLSIIPAEAKNFIKEYSKYSNATKKAKIGEAKERIKVIKDILSDNPNEVLSEPLKDLVRKREGIEAELNTLINIESEADLEALIRKCDLQKELSDALSNEKTAIKKKIDSDDKNYKKSVEWVEKAEKLVNIVNSGFDIYNIYKSHKSAISEIDEAIRINEKNIKDLNEFEERVNAFSQQVITKMKGDVINFQNSLNNKSHMALDVSKWEIQAYLKDIKYQLDNMTSGFKIHSAFIDIFEKMSDAITTLVRIYDRIENYNEQAQLVNYIANVNSAGVAPDYPEINELKIIILQNTILERYSILISAVKQWAFPFAERFFRDFNFMLSIDRKQLIETNVTNITKVIEKLKETIKKYNNTITEMDEKIIKTNFAFEGSLIPSFFTWKSDQYPDTIKTLLREGSKEHESEEVTLTSFVQDSYYNAVKFNKIELNIKHIDSTKQQELNSCLENFNIYLTHSTDSYYLFNNKYYKFGGNIDITSNNKLQLMYGFKKDKNGSPFTKNKAYEKLDEGELMLSPYSVWKVKLVLVNSSSGKNHFTDLEKYSGSVNLELVGKGSYVDEKEMSYEYKSILSVDYYYDIDDTYRAIV